MRRTEKSPGRNQASRQALQFCKNARLLSEHGIALIRQLLCQPKRPPTSYFIWGVDVAPYGPVELSTLVEWIKDERVLAETWVFAQHAGSWLRAAEIPELLKLKVFLEPISATEFATAVSSAGIKPGSLRRIKILADLNDAQLAHLARVHGIARVPQWAVVVKQGDPGDAMYLIIDGELRARTMSRRQGNDSGHVRPRRFFRRHGAVRPRAALGGRGRQHGQHVLKISDVFV